MRKKGTPRRTKCISILLIADQLLFLRVSKEFQIFAEEKKWRFRIVCRRFRIDTWSMFCICSTYVKRATLVSIHEYIEIIPQIISQEVQWSQIRWPRWSFQFTISSSHPPSELILFLLCWMSEAQEFRYEMLPFNRGCIYTDSTIQFDLMSCK